MNLPKQKGVGLFHIIGFMALFLTLAVGFNVYKNNEKKTSIARQQLLQKEEDTRKLEFQQQSQKEESTRKLELIRSLNVEKDKVLSIQSRWDDAVKLAGMTSRITLSQSIAQMQAVKREMDELRIDPCFDKSTKAMASGMNDAIFAFELFIRYPSNNSASDSTAKYLVTSSDKILAAKRELDTCVVVGQ